MSNTDKCLALAGLASAMLFSGPGLRANETRTLYVANNAVDSPGCGTSAEPCRSISQAIANAQSGEVLS